MINKAFVISLERTPERLTAFWDKFPKDWPFAKPVVFPAVDGKINPPPAYYKSSAGWWGALQSHLQIVKKCLADKDNEPVLILEDDAYVANLPAVVDAVDHVPQDADFLFLGGRHIWRPNPIQEHLVRCFCVDKLHAYVVYPKIFSAFIEVLDTWEYAMGRAMGSWQCYSNGSAGLRKDKRPFKTPCIGYACEPLSIFQMDMPSTKKM